MITLPLGVLVAFIALHLQGVTANLMSLGGIAIAIGAMVDAAIVMIENAHKHLEHWRNANDGREPQGAERWSLVADAAVEVGPALFVSLLIIALSFVPVFALQGQEGKLFKPLAFTKTYAMAAAAGLAVTLVPVLMGYLIRGRIRAERDNPLPFWRTTMKSFTACLSLPLLLASLTMGSLAYAADSYTDGWIGHVNGRQLDICYRVTPLPAVDTRLQVMRVAYVIPNKGLPRQQFAVSGYATVTSIIDAHCVRAELTQGTARRTDHARRTD
ncbi:efflux RND transporter permease subunit [Rhodanobacter lindaniclasticus]